jgi:hypothetical protein
MLFAHILLGDAFPKRHRANYGVIVVIRKVPILGRRKWYQSPGFVDTRGSALPVG